MRHCFAYRLACLLFLFACLVGANGIGIAPKALADDSGVNPPPPNPPDPGDSLGQGSSMPRYIGEPGSVSSEGSDSAPGTGELLLMALKAII